MLSRVCRGREWESAGSASRAATAPHTRAPRSLRAATPTTPTTMLTYRITLNYKTSGNRGKNLSDGSISTRGNEIFNNFIS